MDSTPPDKVLERRETLVDILSKDSDSALEKYQDLYVGSRSLGALLKYELLTGLLGSIPGSGGFLLRKVFYKRLFAATGRGSIIGPSLTVRCPNHIWLGENVAIDAGVVLDGKGKDSAIRVGNGVLIGSGTIISCASAEIFMGNDVSIGPGCYLRASLGPVQLGSYITIGAHTVIISGNPDYKRLDIPMMKQQGQAKGIVIEDDIWIGVGVRIIDGVHIGRGSVIGAGAVVIGDIPPYSIAVGVPARIVGFRNGQD